MWSIAILLLTRHRIHKLKVQLIVFSLPILALVYTPLILNSGNSFSTHITNPWSWFLLVIHEVNWPLGYTWRDRLVWEYYILRNRWWLLLSNVWPRCIASDLLLISYPRAWCWIKLLVFYLRIRRGLLSCRSLIGNLWAGVGRRGRHWNAMTSRISYKCPWILFRCGFL